MSTHSIPRATARAESIRSTGFSPHWTWLVRGLALGFVVPFVLTDVLELHRDLFYGLYALAVAALFASWSHATGYDLVGAVRRRWPLALAILKAMPQSPPSKCALTWSTHCSAIRTQ